MLVTWRMLLIVLAVCAGVALFRLKRRARRVELPAMPEPPGGLDVLGWLFRQ